MYKVFLKLVFTQYKGKTKLKDFQGNLRSKSFF